MRISLCLVVWNELEGCKIDVPALPRDVFHEVYAVDGGSTDGTIEYLQSQCITVHPQTKRGLNAAYIDANALSTGDAVVVFFPKGTVPVEHLKRFAPLFDQGNGLVIASRQLRGSTNKEDINPLRPRKWSVFGLAIVAMLLWRREGAWIRDVLHGIKGWTREAFARMKILDYGLSIDIEMVARSYKLRIPRVEFPTNENARAHGVTHFKFWPTGKKLLAYLWFELWRKD